MSIDTPRYFISSSHIIDSCSHLVPITRPYFEDNIATQRVHRDRVAVSMAVEEPKYRHLLHLEQLVGQRFLILGQARVARCLSLAPSPRSLGSSRLPSWSTCLFLERIGS